MPPKRILNLHYHHVGHALGTASHTHAPACTLTNAVAGYVYPQQSPSPTYLTVTIGTPKLTTGAWGVPFSWFQRDSATLKLSEEQNNAGGLTSVNNSQTGTYTLPPGSSIQTTVSVNINYGAGGYTFSDWKAVASDGSTYTTAATQKCDLTAAITGGMPLGGTQGFVLAKQ